MRWEKLGKIFDPARVALPENCREFAQSPQALILDDRVRVYFSTRERDSTGKYLSHVAFADFDQRFASLRAVAARPVMPLGQLGAFDEHGIFPFSVTQDGRRLLAYTTGWSRRVSVSADASVGLATSFDGGITFERAGPGPVLTASLSEPFLVCDAFVSRLEGMLHMWYIYGTRWFSDSTEPEPQRVYKIAHAVSEDGIAWRRDSRPIISDRIDSNECQALPTVAWWRDRYHMFFCYRHATRFRQQVDRGYRIGYAWSTDLATWNRDDELGGLAGTPGAWDSDMQCYPHVFAHDGDLWLLYNGNEFGRYGFGLARLLE